jgi:cytochrome c553
MHRSSTGFSLSALKRGLVLVAALVCIASPAAAQAMAERLAPCLACHGEHGTSSTPDVPSLGGQPAFYVMVQLLMFRERMRPIQPMSEMLKGASDDALRAMADTIAKLPPPQPATDAADPARVARAQDLVAQHRCNFCHNPDFSGADGVPRLAGQREDYLLKSLRGYKVNTRRAYDPQMADVIEPLTDADFIDLAHYLARVK